MHTFTRIFSPLALDSFLFACCFTCYISTRNKKKIFPLHSYHFSLLYFSGLHTCVRFFPHAVDNPSFPLVHCFSRIYFHISLINLPFHSYNFSFVYFPNVNSFTRLFSPHLWYSLIFHFSCIHFYLWLRNIAFLIIFYFGWKIVKITFSLYFLIIIVPNAGFM